MLELLNVKKSFLALTVAICGVAAHPAYAIMDFGIKGGGNMSTVSDSYNGTSVTGLGYGFGYEFGVSISFLPPLPVGLMVDVLYAHRDITQTGFSDSSGNQLLVPVVAEFGFGPIMIEAGAYYAYGIGNINVSGSSESYAAAGTSNSDFGLVGGLGMKFGPVMAEARFNFGLQNVGSVTPGFTEKNRSIDVLASYWF